MAQAEPHERQNLTGEWSANWSLASCKPATRTYSFSFSLRCMLLMANDCPQGFSI